jgi:hypothetical protein
MAQEEPTVAPLDEFHYFVTPIYITKQPQFLDTVKAIAADSIKQVHGKSKPNKIHPVLMSGNMLEEGFAAPRHAGRLPTRRHPRPASGPHHA